MDHSQAGAIAGRRTITRRAVPGWCSGVGRISGRRISRRHGRWFNRVARRQHAHRTQQLSSFVMASILSAVGAFLNVGLSVGFRALRRVAFVQWRNLNPSFGQT